MQNQAFEYVYYIGTPYYLGPDETQDAFRIPWDIEGIFLTLEEVEKVIVDGEFAVMIPLNTKLPKELCHPEKYWWKLDGVLTPFVYEGGI